MNARPIVSVIVPAYNVDPYIEQAIKSALDQTVRDIEVIVVDDSSTDNTASVVHGFNDLRLKLYRNDKNRGPSFSRNYAIGKAEGQWLAVLDADDWWTPNRLEELLEIGSRYNAEVVCDDVYLIDDGADGPRMTYFKSRERVLGPLNAVKVITPQKLIDDDYTLLKPMVRTSFLRKHGIHYDEQMYVSEDYVFLLDCLLKGAKVVISPRAHYHYRSRAGSLSKTALGSLENHYNIIYELSTKQPYNLNMEVYRSLQRRLRRTSQNLEEIRARELFLQGEYLAAAMVVVSTPGLLIEYARHMKHRLLP